MKITTILLAALPAFTVAQTNDFLLNLWPWNGECKLPNVPRIRPDFIGGPGCIDHSLPANGSVIVLYDKHEKGVAGYPEEGCQGEPVLFFKPGCGSCGGGPSQCYPSEIALKSFRSFGAV